MMLGEGSIMDAQKGCDAGSQIQSHTADCAEILAEKYQRGLISRRDMLAALGALGVMPALGTNVARAAVPDVVMANSGGDSSKWLAATFGAHYEKVTGGKMIMDGSGPSNGKVRAMVEANHVVWDLCDLGPQTLELGPSGLLSAIDYTIVDKNKVIPEFAYEYGVCNYLFAHVLAWDSAVISGTPTLADFFDLKKYPGKRSIRKDPEPMLELALQADGVPQDKLYPLDVDRALKKIASIKDQVIFWETGSQSQTLLRDGEVVMGFLAHTRANLTNKDTNGRIKWTFRGGVLIPSLWIVPAKNPAGKQAMVAIATTQDAETQVALLRALGNGPANPQASALVPDDLKAVNPSTPENFAVLAKMNAEWWMHNFANTMKAFLDMTTG
jgi:putative spermidine/putrescine transport system substrate-binding protein